MLDADRIAAGRIAAGHGRTRTMPKSRNAADAALVDQPAEGRGRRSHLTRWLTRHRKAFAALVAVPEPNWDALARELGAAGVLDGSRKPPTGIRLRKTWWALNRKRPPRAGLAPAPADPTIAVEVGPTTDDDEPPKPHFSFV